MSIVVSIVLLLLAIFAYREQLHQKGSWGLFALRVLVVVFFFFLLAGQVINITWEERTGRVAILIDRSLSMQAIKADSSAVAIAGRVGDGLPRGLRARFWSFGDSLYSGIGGSDFYERTNLGGALERVFRTRPAAVVLLTDGQDNGEQSPVEVVRGSGIPVYVIGFGAAVGRNLRVVEVELPVSVYAGDTVEVRVRMMGSGLESGTQVRVFCAGQSREVVAGPGVSEQDVGFRLVFSEPGRKKVQVQLESLPGEMSYLDNRWDGVLEVKPARVGVAYITNRPGPGTRFILTSLRKNPRVSLMPVVLFSGSLNNRQIPDAEVFIVDGVEEQRDEESWWQGLRRRIEAGAGLLLIAGPDFSPGVVLRGLVPVSAPKLEIGTWTPVQAGDAELLGLFEPGMIDLNELPPFTGLFSGSGVAGVRVWVEAGESGQPLIIEQGLKKGRVVYVAGYPFWRWGFLPDFPVEKETPLAVLLDRVVRFLAEKDTNLFSLQTDAAGYLSGQPVRLRLFARRPDGGFWEGLDVQFKIDTLSRPVPMIERGGGRYEATVSGTGPGEHYAVAEVRKGDKFIGSARVDWTVSVQSVELSRLGLNRTLLARIAEAGNGWLVLAESLDIRRLQDIKPRVLKRRLVLDPRVLPWWLVITAGLFGLEILLRRWKGLY
jgi:hypothetical protein